MTVYLILLLFCALFGIFAAENHGKRSEYICVILIAAIMCALAALRSGDVGVDYIYVYRDYFLAVRENLHPDFIFSPDNLYRREFLFTLFNMAVALFTDEPLVLWGISSTVIIILQTVFFLRYSKKPWLSLYLFIALGFFGYSLCYIRQMLAVSVAFYALPFIERKKPLQCFAVLLAAGFIHNSALLLIPIFILALLPFNRLTAALYAACYGIMLLFSDELILLFTKIIPRFSLYVENGVFSRGSSFKYALLWAVTMLVLLICYPRVKAVYNNTQPLFNLCLFGTFVIMLITRSYMYQRLSLILLPFFTLLIAEAAAAFSPDNSAVGSNPDDEKRFYYTLLVLFMIIALLQFFFCCNTDTLGVYDYSPFWR